MKRLVILLVATFGSSLVGVMLPQAAPHLIYVPTASMIMQLLFCFLSTSEPGTSPPTGSLRALPGFLLTKMFVIPLVCWVSARLLFPEYALGTLLVSGASIGVMGPFFAFLCGAEPFFVVGGVIASSLMLPVSIPLLAAIALFYDGGAADGLMDACFGSAAFLALCMLLPFAVAKLLWKWLPSTANHILNRRFGITMLCVVSANFTIFSRFSAPLLNNLTAMAEALAAGLLTAALLLGIGIAMARYQPIALALSRIIGISCVNCLLMAIVAVEFFSLPEVLVCTLYSLPLMCMGVPYELCRIWLRRRENSRDCSEQCAD